MDLSVKARKGYSIFPKLQDGNLAIRWFNVKSMTFVVVVVFFFYLSAEMQLAYSTMFLRFSDSYILSQVIYAIITVFVLILKHYIRFTSKTGLHHGFLEPVYDVRRGISVF